MNEQVSKSVFINLNVQYYLGWKSDYQLFSSFFLMPIHADNMYVIYIFDTDILIKWVLKRE